MKSLNLISLEFEGLSPFKKGFLKQDNIRQNFQRIQKRSEFTGLWTGPCGCLHLRDAVFLHALEGSRKDEGKHFC